MNTVVEQTPVIKMDHIALHTIELSTTNEMFRDQNELSPNALKELIDSITQKGVIQPVLLRPHASKPNAYILVCGERRLRASLAVETQHPERNTIPAYVREMNDDEAFELQLTENLQRKDVHPLKEAIAYKYMLDNIPNTNTHELALRFGKSESYITQRLKLNDLIPPAAKDFQQNKMSLGHALLIAKLTPQNQKETIRVSTNRHDGYGTFKELDQYIKRHIMCDLNEAPFDTESKTLLPKAGACTTCMKRTGCSPLLFADIKQKNTCTDKNCFDQKNKTHLINITKEIIDTQPEVYLIRTYSEPEREIEELITENKLTTLKQYTDFETISKSKIKGLWISGRDQGKIVPIKLTKSVKATPDTLPDGTLNVPVRISKILAHAKALASNDKKKIHMKIVDRILNHPNTKHNSTKKMLPEETALLYFLAYENSGYQALPQLKKHLKLKETSYSTTPQNAIENAKIFSSLSDTQKALIFRTMMKNKYCGEYPDTTFVTIPLKVYHSFQSKVYQFIDQSDGS